MDSKDSRFVASVLKLSNNTNASTKYDNCSLCQSTLPPWSNSLGRHLLEWLFNDARGTQSLALTRRTPKKGFLHAFSLLGFGSALYMGCFPNVTPSRAHSCFLLMAGGAWASFIFDTNAAFINAALPLGAEKTGAIADADGFNSTMLKLSAMAMAFGSTLLCAGIDFSLLMGGSGDNDKKKI